MALNADLKIMEDAGLFVDGLVKGGVDKQNVANDIRKLREKKDKKGIDAYIAKLKSDRAIANVKTDPQAIAALTKLVNDQNLKIKQLTESQSTSKDVEALTSLVTEQSTQIKELTEKISSLETEKTPVENPPKGNTENNGGNK